MKNSTNASSGIRDDAAEGAGSSRAPAWNESRFLKACRLERVDVTPVWLMRQAGRYMPEYRRLRARTPFLKLCKTPDLVAEVTVSAAEKIGADAAIIFADLLLLAEPLGFRIEYEKGEGPLVHPALRSRRDVERMPKADPRGALEYFYEGIRRTRAQLDPHTPLIGFAGAPFTLASYLIEGGSSRTFERTKRMMYTEPAAWRALMKRLVRALALYVKGQITAGVQAVQIFDTWAGCLAPADYRAFVQPFSRALIRSIEAPVIHFSTGSPALTEALAEAGGAVIGLDHREDLDAAWARLGPGIGVQGNLDPAVLLGGRRVIRSNVERILRQAARRPGHIFNLGHGVLPETPFENVVALIEMVHEMSARQRAT